jgi:hypothetical protein
LGWIALSEVIKILVKLSLELILFFFNTEVLLIEEGILRKQMVRIPNWRIVATDGLFKVLFPVL